MEIVVARVSVRPVCAPLTRRRVGAMLAGTVTAAFLARTSAQSQSHPLRFGYTLPEDSQLGVGAAAFDAELSFATKDRLQITQFPNSTLGDEVTMLKGVQNGSIDLAFISGVALPNIVPEVGVFNIPFLFRDVKHAHDVLDSVIGDFFLEKVRARGLVALAWGENGTRHITNAKQPIREPGDLKGLKLRLPQSEVMLAGFKALGADAAPLPFTKLYDALKAGQLDGQENPIQTIIAANLNQVQKHLTLSSHVYDPAVIVMSVDAYGKLSPDERKAIIGAAKFGAKASRVYAESQAKGVVSLGRAGMQVVSDVDTARFAASMAAANPAFEKRFGTDLIAKIRAVA
jgi:tripartite ATP-independent transporter DctP family solute receptor